MKCGSAMTTDEKVEHLIQENRQLARALRSMKLLGFGAVAAIACFAFAVLAGAAQNPSDDLQGKSFTLLDKNGMARVRIVVSTNAGPESPALDIQDSQGRTIAQIGDSNNAGPSVQLYADGKCRSILSYMGSYLYAPEAGKPVQISAGHNSERDASAFLYLGQSGNDSFPTLSLKRQVSGGSETADLRVDKMGPALVLKDKNGKVTKLP